MKIAIISDVHDNLRILSRSIEYFNHLNVDVLIHCGDWVMPFTLRTFVPFKGKIYGVLGNGDPDIQKYLYQIQNLDVLKNLNIDLKPVFQDIVFDGKRFAVFHGDDESLLNVLAESQLFDFICHGHNHVSSIRKVGKTTIINPGSMVGYKAETGIEPVFFGFYDTDTNKVELVNLDEVKM